MNNPFQEQLLKAGIVTKQQVNKVNQQKFKQKKQQRNIKQVAVDENSLKAQRAASAKAERDRELNQKKEQQARNRAISIEINQLIKDNRIKRDERCEIAYNFEHQNKIKRLYINEDMKQQLLRGKLGIARLEGNYELVSISVAEKIKQRNDKRIIIFDTTQQPTDENDPYADHQIPDDLMW